jgi:hypothetical protein
MATNISETWNSVAKISADLTSVWTSPHSQA